MTDVKKVQYQLDEALEKPNFTKISQKAMKIWNQTLEGSEMFDLVKDLIDTIEEEQRKADNLKSLMYLLAGKM